MFEACGAADEVFSEADLDYLTGLVGSGAAYPALLAEAMLAHSPARGLPPADRRARGTRCDGGGEPIARSRRHVTGRHGPGHARLLRHYHGGLAGDDRRRVVARRMQARYAKPEQ